jgi:transcriptional regulator with XRE-family HTH domain
MQKLSGMKKGRPDGSRTFDPIPALAFGQAIKELRLEKSLSQEELAHKASIERSHMGKIERGEHLPNLVLILRIANALSITPGSLIDKVQSNLQRGSE